MKAQFEIGDRVLFDPVMPAGTIVEKRGGDLYRIEYKSWPTDKETQSINVPGSRLKFAPEGM